LSAVSDTRMNGHSPLPDLADGTPCGPDLELDPAFGELERSAQGKPESQFGDTVQPATPPDWEETARLDLTAKMIPIMVETVEKFSAMGATPEHIKRFLQATIDEINNGPR